MAGAAFQVTQGTQTQLANDVVGTNMYPISKIDIGVAGATVPWAGTVTANLTSGGTITQVSTLQSLNALQAGTINNGTVDTISRFPPANWSTTINTTGTALGTIKSLVSGSAIYVTDLMISVPQISNVAVFSGTAQVIAGTFYFAGNGGVVENYRIPISTASGSQLTYQQSGTGALAINVQGYVL